MVVLDFFLKNGRSLPRRFGYPRVCEVVAKRMLSTETSKRISSSLKSMMKPFFLKCHPDVQTSEASKQVNLEAIQNINSFFDSLDATCEGKVVDWPKTVPIEFLLTVENFTMRKKKPIEAITRKKVELVVPPMWLRDKIVQSTGMHRQDLVQKLQTSVQHELGKILQIAGLPLPPGISPHPKLPDNYWNEHSDQQDRAESNSYRVRNFTEDTRPKTKYQESKERFMKSFDVRKFDRMYKEAIQDLQAHVTMQGLIQKNASLRQSLVNHIISKVRISADSNISLHEQLIALRRISLILEDNFEWLHMEDFGRMWEELIIILVDPRSLGTPDNSVRKRRKRGQESGFKFTYGADNRVTIHIPTDFREDELLNELDRNLSDWFSMVSVGPEDCFNKEL